MNTITDIFKLFLFGVGFLLMSAIAGIPFADMHTCELPNGDKVKTRTSSNWYLLKGLNPHGSGWGKETVKSWYVPKEWWKFRMSSQYELNCVNSRMFGELISLNERRFIKKNDELSPLNISSAEVLDGWRGFHWTLTAQEQQQQLIEIKNARKKGRDFNVEFAFYNRIDKQKRKQYGIDEHLQLGYYSFMGKFGKEFWYEFSFVDEKCNQNSLCPIISVWQYHSTDGGKTWSRPIITKDAKLFVIGKTIKEQPGVAKDKGTLKYIGWF